LSAVALLRHNLGQVVAGVSELGSYDHMALARLYIFIMKSYTRYTIKRK